MMAYVGTNNAMDPCATPSIALRKSNNSNGFFFVSLDTGKHIHCNKWTQLILSDSIVESVHLLCHDDPTPPPDKPDFFLVDSTDPFPDNAPPKEQTHTSNQSVDQPDIISTHLRSIPNDDSPMTLHVTTISPSMMTPSKT